MVVFVMCLAPMTAPTIPAKICPLKAPVVAGRKGGMIMSGKCSEALNKKR